MALVFYYTLVVFSMYIAQADDFFPHGLEFETPVALAPSAHNFFNSMARPGQQQADIHVEHLCAGSVCSPMPHAAEVEAAHELQGSKRESLASHAANHRVLLSGRGIACIVLGFVAFVFIGSVAYYVVTTRKANLIRGRPIEPLA